MPVATQAAGESVGNVIGTFIEIPIVSAISFCEELLPLASKFVEYEICEFDVLSTGSSNLNL